MRLVDSHAHLDMPEFDPDRSEVVRRAFAAGLVAILCPTELARPDGLAAIEALAAEFGPILAAAGVHPHQAKDLADDQLRRLEALAGRSALRAVGEIGLDYHYDFSPQEAQRRALRVQLAFAERAGLPVILHSRLAGPDIIAAVDGERFGRGGILHCFTEDWPIASAMLDRGFLISFSGILTFPKAGALREVAARVPLDRLLVETDSPYLAPVPYRGAGRRNEPAYVVETARVLAGLKGLAPEDLAEATTRNFAGLFPFENAAGR
ncbi:MAG TPA: TatD family hydrolase [Candidatus Aminicenantes bacterium]|nr:TatD family hydrolase [Candidatus Aminicenantes bacterium]HRY66082.1 TatD family hydrolase [Candidatus Aminicenantes bacterium]HRZ72869.1 TatD family hydrolase [Candidatus Aminicenantes bacterium]